MNTRVDSEFINEIKKYGAGDWNACFHCGNCTAVCSLTEESMLFPRKDIRAIQMGLKNKLVTSADAWLCYYCGDCSETCPRDANPGALMMSLRRYLTSVYDWTGLAGRLYKSFISHLLLMIGLFVAVIAGFLLFGGPMLDTLTPQGGVPINTFAPAETIEFIDHILLLSLGFILLTNMFHMYYHVILKDKSIKIPLSSYFTEVGSAIFHFFTQWKFFKCANKKVYWLAHWFLMISYLTMFVFIIFYLTWFQTDEIHPWYHPQRLVGYIITAGFLFGTLYFIIGRLRNKEEIFKNSHHSDWIFIVLLFFVALTGILIHIFRVNGLALPTYYMYVLHLAFEVPFVVTFVVFSKWSHLAYRPLAIFLAQLKRTVYKKQVGLKLETVS